MSLDSQIAPGVKVTASGQAIVDPSLTDVLCDLAITMEESTNLPVDVEHVVAALVLASRAGKIDPSTQLASDDPALIDVLTVQVKTVFAKYGSSVGSDDS